MDVRKCRRISRHLPRTRGRDKTDESVKFARANLRTSTRTRGRDKLFTV